jgi:hypothetical protein
MRILSKLGKFKKLLNPINYEFLLPTIEILNICGLATAVNQIPNELKVALSNNY